MPGFLTIFKQLPCGGWLAEVRRALARGCGRTREEARAEALAELEHECWIRKKEGLPPRRPEVRMRRLRTDRVGRLRAGDMERISPRAGAVPEEPRAKGSLREVMTDGRLGPVRLGMSPDQVVELLGMPRFADGWLVGPTDGKDAYWRYGDIELMIVPREAGPRVERIKIEVMFARSGVVSGGRKLAVDPWIVRPGMDVTEFIEAAAADGVPPTGLLNNNTDAGGGRFSMVRFGDDDHSGVQIQFSPLDDEEAERVREVSMLMQKIWVGVEVWTEWIPAETAKEG